MALNLNSFLIFYWFILISNQFYMINFECMTFAPATIIAPVINTNVKRNPNPNPIGRILILTLPRTKIPIITLALALCCPRDHGRSNMLDHLNFRSKWSFLIICVLSKLISWHPLAAVRRRRAALGVGTGLLRGGRSCRIRCHQIQRGRPGMLDGFFFLQNIVQLHLRKGPVHLFHFFLGGGEGEGTHIPNHCRKTTMPE